MTAQPASTPLDKRAVLYRLALIIALVVLSLGVVDVALRVIVPRTQLLQQTIDIQSPEALSVKLDQLQKFDGVKIVVLGDSLAFGRTMRDKGDRDWQQHTLSSQLQAELTRKYPGRPIMVANLGMNGTLPTDLDQLMRIILPLKPDLIIFDLTLRSFSRDFASEKDRVSRPWLADMPLNNPIAKYWYLYRIKDTLQSTLFDGQPVTYLTQQRNKLDTWFKHAPEPAEDEFMLLFKARARYDLIDMADDNPQKQALVHVLSQLKDAGQPAIVFYATENKEKLPDLIEMPKYKALQKQLKDTMIADGGKNVKWVGPLDIYTPDNYLDHVHLDQHGYQKLVTRILPLVEDALNLRKH